MSQLISVPRYIYQHHLAMENGEQDLQHYCFCSDFLTEYCGRASDNYVVKVIGRALEPDVTPGSLVLVRADFNDLSYSTAGDLWVVDDDGELVIARCIFSGLDLKYLTSRNDELESPQVFGRVMMTITRV